MEILRELDKAFQDDEHIDEIGIIVAEKPEGDSAVGAIRLTEHKLGLCHWALKSLLEYCLCNFFKSYHLIRKDHITIQSVSSELKSLTRAILIVKGDTPLALGIRKELIACGHIPVNDELNFLKLIFPRHPKSPSLWQHRRWCLCYDCRGVIRRFDECELQIEVNLCSYLSDIYPKNYYSWVHRLWLLQFMNRDQVSKTHAPTYMLGFILFILT